LRALHTISRVISIVDLRGIAEARLEDAKVLLANGRIDAAAYICGYAIELVLKARICVTLNWEGFPHERKEFEHLASFKTHRLHVLIALSGQEQRIKDEYLSEWSEVETWDPESRYKAVGLAEVAAIERMITAVETLLKVL